MLVADLVVLELAGALVSVEDFDAGVLVVLELVVVECCGRAGATEKQAQSRPARCNRCTALSKVSPVTSGTMVPWG